MESSPYIVYRGSKSGDHMPRSLACTSASLYPNPCGCLFDAISRASVRMAEVKEQVDVLWCRHLEKLLMRMCWVGLLVSPGLRRVRLLLVVLGSCGVASVKYSR